MCKMDRRYREEGWSNFIFVRTDFRKNYDYLGLEIFNEYFKQCSEPPLPLKILSDMQLYQATVQYIFLIHLLINKNIFDRKRLRVRISDTVCYDKKCMLLINNIFYLINFEKKITFSMSPLPAKTALAG